MTIINSSFEWNMPGHGHLRYIGRHCLAPEDSTRWNAFKIKDVYLKLPSRKRPFPILSYCSCFTLKLPEKCIRFLEWKKEKKRPEAKREEKNYLCVLAFESQTPLFKCSKFTFGFSWISPKKPKKKKIKKQINELNTRTRGSMRRSVDDGIATPCSPCEMPHRISEMAHQRWNITAV